MLTGNTHIALAVNRLKASGKFGTRFRIKCLPSDMKRFVSWNDATMNHVADQGYIYLKANGIEVTGNSWDEGSLASILLVNWSLENIKKLGDINLW